MDWELEEGARVVDEEGNVLVEGGGGPDEAWELLSVVGVALPVLFGVVFLAIAGTIIWKLATGRAGSPVRRGRRHGTPASSGGWWAGSPHGGGAGDGGLGTDSGCGSSPSSCSSSSSCSSPSPSSCSSSSSSCGGGGGSSD
ncbi:hypothetical protein [Streptomyces sp. TRM64462]|uniref:hypothetical protein n=1 Tax=Streptomyces sp. TRM64462 TaxID=2741726 RepID=UPI00158666B1|nr:hypothetical protein [Streptomyces sp. TRM64462]